MLFKIQKPTFTRLYYYYLRKLRKTLWVLAAHAFFMVLLFFSTRVLGFEEGMAATFMSGVKISSASHYQIFLLISFGLSMSLTGMLVFLYYVARKLNNISGFLQSKRSQAEESCILLFTCPITRQTITAAKLAAFATYWGGVNLVGLTIPTCLILAANTQFSFLAILGYFFLSGFLLNLVSFCWLALPSLYNGVVSGKKFFFGCFFLIVAGIAHNLTYLLLPAWVSLPLFLVSVIAGGYFAWQYWKSFQCQDLV